MVTLVASAVLASLLVSCSQNTDTATIVPPDTTRPPEPKCGNGEIPQWLMDEETWLCPAVTTTTQRPSPPDCAWLQIAKWQTTRWRCVKVSVSDILMLRGCEDIVSPLVDANEGFRRASDDIIQAGVVFNLIEITGRLDSESVCTAKGMEYDYVVCSNDTWSYIISIRETDRNPIVNAGTRCINELRESTGKAIFPCWAGWIDRTDSSGTRRCYPTPECGSSLVVIYVSESDSYECSETEEMASQFWEYAFYAMGIRDDYQKARWIGGLGTTYNKNLWREDRALPGYDYEGGLKVWDYIDQASAGEQMEDIAKGTSHVHICYEHDCERAGNLVGSTDGSVSSCRAFVWHTEGGLWFLMRIDESVSVCVRAFEKVASREINGASVGYASLREHTGRTAPRDGIERPVYYKYDVEFEEITLTQGSEDDTPGDNNTWVAAIDLRE